MATRDPGTMQRGADGSTSLLIVGLVRGGAWARDVRQSADLSLAGIVDIDAQRLQQAGESLDVPRERRFPDLRAALDVDADVVVIATPTPTHAELSLMALRAGHTVICEKPLARSLEEARALREQVGASGGRFMVGENYRFADGMENLRRAIAGGLIGRPLYLDHQFRRAGSGARPNRPAAAPPEPDRGIPEMSVHHFDMWWYATGQRPLEIRADPIAPPWMEGGRRFGYSMRATLEGGAHVHYLTSRALSRPQTTWPGTLTVVGEEGTLSWDGSGAAVTLTRELPTHDYREQHLSSGPLTYVSHDAPPGQPAGLPAASPAPPGVVGGAGGARSSTMQMVRALVQAIREGRPHPNDLADNWPSFATAMAALESVRTGQPVRVASE
jgi:predicted dehydrogenase